MTFDQYKAAFNRDGYVVVQEFLPLPEFNELQKHLDRYIREKVPGLPDTHAFYDDKSRPETLKQMQHMSLDPFFRDFREHALWRSLAETLIGEQVHSMEPEWFNKPPGTNHVTPPHQDNYYFCLSPANVVTIWMALDSVDDENGCLRYVQGSHQRGIRPHSRSNVLGFSQGISDYSAADRGMEHEIHLQPGDVVVHHGNTIHRADANRSQVRNRRAFATVYKGVSCRRDENAFARYEAALKAQHAEMGLKH